MADPIQDWQRYLKDLQGDPGPHLSDATLAAYHGGALSPAEDDAIQEHLAGCPLCSQLLLELAEPLDETIPPFPADSAAVPSWAAVRAELARDGWFEPPRSEPAAPQLSWWRRLLFPPAPMRWRQSREYSRSQTCAPRPRPTRGCSNSTPLIDCIQRKGAKTRRTALYFECSPCLGAFAS